MVHLFFKHTIVWLLLLSAPMALSQVYLADAPRFAIAGQAIELRAFDDKAPAAVTVAWQSDTTSGTRDMARNTDCGSWTTTLAGSVIQGSHITLTVTADYDNAAQTSTVCTIFIAPQYIPLDVDTLPLKQTILAQTKWNSDEQAFGLLKPEAGPPLGPASLAYHNGQVFVLDTVNSRVLSLDRDGQQTTAAVVPTALASDLLVDAADGSLLVISQMDDSIYRFENGQLSETWTVAMKKNFEYPAKYSYDSTARSLYIQKQDSSERLTGAASPQTAALSPAQKALPAVTDVQNNQILLKTPGRPEVFAITFDGPVAYIDETLIDDNGVAWLLFTRRGDYRIRRLARIDMIRQQAQTAPVDVWFSFDATRRMTATDTGVALMAGDAIHGRVVMFDYAGDI